MGLLIGSPLLLLLLVIVLCAILPQENADWLFLVCMIYIVVYFVWLAWKPRGGSWNRFD